MSSYEAHLTVDSADAITAERLAISLGLRFVHIELAAGQTPSQPMLTFVEPRSLAYALDRARAIVAQCELDRMVVRRIKIECELDAPECAQDEQRCDPVEGRYFEAHVKIALVEDEARARAATIAAQLGAHRSRNARRTTGDREERFLTVRSSRRASLVRAVDALVAAIESASIEVLSRREEYVVYDSARSLDHGWDDRPQHEGDQRSPMVQRASAASPERRS